MGVVLRADNHAEIRLTDEQAWTVIGSLWDAESFRGSATVAAQMTEELGRGDKLRKGLYLDVRGMAAVDAALTRFDT